MIGWLAFLVGIAYGYFSPGRQDIGTLLKKGALWGILIAVVLAVIGYFMDFSILFGRSVTGNILIDNIIGAIVVVLIFVAGVWIGDWIEHRKAGRTTRPATRNP